MQNLLENIERMDRMKTCAIVGWHPTRFKFKYKETHTGCKRLKRRLKEQFIKQYEQGIRTFLIGSSLGVDIWSGEILIKMREDSECSDIHLVVVIPFNGHDKDWDKHNQMRLSFLKAHAEVVVVSCKSEPESYYKQSQYFLNRADCLIAVFDMDYTVRSHVSRIVSKAVRRKIPVTYIHPDTGEIT